MKNDIKLYLLTNGLFELARTLPHAFVTIYLLEKGISISQITSAQILFMIAITLCEIPSGLIADKNNKKVVFFISCSVLSVSYFLYSKIENYIALFVAQFLYGVAMSLKSGTIDSLLISKIHTYDIGLLEDFIRLENIVNIAAMLIGASIGMYAYSLGFKSVIYYSAIGVFLLSAIISFFLPEDTGCKEDINMNALIKQLYTSIKIIKKDKKMLLLMLLLGCLQFFLQPLYNYWQPIARGVGFQEKDLLKIYIAIQILGIFATIIYKKYFYKKEIKKILLIGLSIQLIIIVIGNLLNGKSMMYAIVLIIVPNTCMSIKLTTDLQKRTANSIRSTTTSISSSIVRMFAGLILGFMTVWSKWEGNLSLILSVGVVMSCMSVGILRLYINRN